MNERTTDGGLRSYHSRRDNPYLILESTWQMTKPRNDVDANELAMDECGDQSIGLRAVSPISIGSSSSAEQQRTTENNVKRLNLSAICISNILMLEDRHLPSIFIRMYERCLMINERDPDDADNRTRLRLLNYLIQRWHETRGRLNFYRDVMRVVGALAKPILGDHINIAVESTKIDQQHVMSELMRNLRLETNGRTLGEYLESFSQTAAMSSSSQFTFNDMTLELFTRNEVLSYERSNVGGGGGFSGAIGELIAHPLAIYGKRVLFVLLQAICRLKLNIPTSVSNKLFAPSVPSWVEEDTETGMINCDEATKRRIAEARKNITNILLRRRDKLDAQQKRTTVVEKTDSQEHAGNRDKVNRVSPGGVNQTIDKKDGGDVVLDIDSENAKDDEPCANDDELCTVDTESFVAFPAVSTAVQARSMSALRHMESTVHRVLDADRFADETLANADTNCQTDEPKTSPTAPRSSGVGFSPKLVSDQELWQTLQQNFTLNSTLNPTTNIANRSQDSLRETTTIKRRRLSTLTDGVDRDSIVDYDDEDKDDADNDDDCNLARDASMLYASVRRNDESSSLLSSTDASVTSTVGRIRSNDRDLSFLASSGYDDELGRQLDNLDSMFVSDEDPLANEPPGMDSTRDQTTDMHKENDTDRNAASIADDFGDLL